MNKPKTTEGKKREQLKRNIIAWTKKHYFMVLESSKKDLEKLLNTVNI